jgi:hypothetical protein
MNDESQVGLESKRGHGAASQKRTFGTWLRSPGGLVISALLAIVVIFVGMVWNSSRETNQFIEAKRAELKATLVRAEVAEREGRREEATRLYRQCAEMAERIKAYEADPVEAAIDLEVAKNKDVLKDVLK